METINYAVIGSGMMGQEHIRNLAIVNETQNWQSNIVATENVDAYVIVTPNFTHHAIITELLPLQKPILAEKPVCTTLSQCTDLLKQLTNYPAAFWVAMEYRYMPPTAKFIERLREGVVGSMRMLTIKEHRYPFLEKVDDWNRFSENTGGYY